MFNQCPHPTTTTRRIPLEMWDSPDKPGNRVPDALLHTCTVCGASFYLPEVFLKIGYPVPPPTEQPVVQSDSQD